MSSTSFVLTVSMKPTRKAFEFGRSGAIVKRRAGKGLAVVEKWEGLIDEFRWALCAIVVAFWE